MTESIDFQNLALITGEDENYQQELIRLYVETFKKLPILFEEALLARDSRQLSAFIHKVKPSLLLLGLEDCLSALKKGQVLIEQATTPQEELQSLSDSIKIHCQSYINQLIQYQNL